MPYLPAIWVYPTLWTLINARGPTPLVEQLVQVTTAPDKLPNYKVREIVLEADPDRICPSGFDQTGGNCLQVDSLPVSYQCPPGWQTSVDGERCMGYSALLPEHTCDEGRADFDQCIIERTSPKLLICPEGFSLDATYSECAAEVTHRALEVCEPGAHLVNGVCVLMRTENPVTRCPGDFILQNGECVSSIEEPAILQCPPGFSLTPNGKKQTCQRTVLTDPSRRCPAKFSLVGGDCVMEYHVPPTYICKKGESMDGNRCLIAVPSAPQTICANGGQLNPMTGLCEIDDVKAPMAECTKGTHYNPLTNQCGSANKLKQPNLACPPDYHFVGKTHCVRHLAEVPEKVCEPGATLVSKDQCLRKEMILPEARCPPGTQFSNNLCVAIEVAPFELLCDLGAVLEGKKCVQQALSEPTLRCPTDLSLTPAGTCIAKIAAPPMALCPAGTTQRADATGLVCLEAHETPALPTCPISMVSRGSECVEIVKTVPVLECPSGYFEDLRLNRCFHSSLAPRRSFCPIGFNLIGERCLKQELTPLLSICPPSYTQTNSQQTGEPICVKETVVPFINVCPMGFDFDNGICRAVKLQYEFDEATLESQVRPTEPEQEQNLPMESPAPMSAPEPEPTIEVTVNKPVVQKGLVMRSEPVTLSGPASEVARQQAILNAGGDVKDLDPNVRVEYAPSPIASQPANLAALLSVLGRHLLAI